MSESIKVTSGRCDRKLFNRFTPVRGLADQAHILLMGDERGDPFSDQRVVGNRENANLSGTGSHLKTAQTPEWLRRGAREAGRARLETKFALLASPDSI